MLSLKTGPEYNENPMPGMVFQYILDNKNVGKAGAAGAFVYNYLPKIKRYADGTFELIDPHYLDTFKSGAGRDQHVAIICDDGYGKPVYDTQYLIGCIPTIVDLNFHYDVKEKKKLQENHEKESKADFDHDILNLDHYAGARIVSMDKETVDILGRDPYQLQRKYNWDNVIVNHGLHSIWFTRLGVNSIFDFKYRDGIENEATYESKREIVAGLAAEFTLNNYKIYDNENVYVPQRVFRDYWAEHFEHEKLISLDQALAILGLQTQRPGK